MILEHPFLVPGSITLPGLHRVIQEIMGWENCHLHLFQFGKKEYRIPIPSTPRRCGTNGAGVCANFSATRGMCMVEWRGPSFDPERFDPKRINCRLPLILQRIA